MKLLLFAITLMISLLDDESNWNDAACWYGSIPPSFASSWKITTWRCLNFNRTSIELVNSPPSPSKRRAKKDWKPICFEFYQSHRSDIFQRTWNIVSIVQNLLYGHVVKRNFSCCQSGKIFMIKTLDNMDLNQFFELK